MQVTKASLGESIYISEIGKGYRWPLSLFQRALSPPHILVLTPEAEVEAVLGLPNGGQESIVNFQMVKALSTRGGGWTSS